MFIRRQRFQIETDRLLLRPPIHADYRDWVALRSSNRDFLKPWDPLWAEDHLTRRSFTNRVYWAQRSVAGSNALPLLVLRKSDLAMMGGITLDNIRRGPAMAGTLGYWIGHDYIRNRYMSEAVEGVVNYAFGRLDLSRIEAACLPENAASRGVLEKSGFKYEGVAQSYLQIAGRWRTHVLYACLRGDRRGRTDAGL